MLLQKQAQDQAEIASHMETIAQRDVEIRNSRLDVQKVWCRRGSAGPQHY